VISLPLINIFNKTDVATFSMQTILPEHFFSQIYYDDSSICYFMTVFFIMRNKAVTRYCLNQNNAKNSTCCYLK